MSVCVRLDFLVRNTLKAMREVWLGLKLFWKLISRLWLTGLVSWSSTSWRMKIPTRPGRCPQSSNILCQFVAKFKRFPQTLQKTGCGSWKRGLREAGDVVPPHLQPPACSGLLLILEAWLHCRGAPGEEIWVRLMTELTNPQSTQCSVGKYPLSSWIPRKWYKN